MKLTSVRVSVVIFVAYNLASQTNTNSNHKSGCSILSCQLKFGHFSAIILHIRPKFHHLRYTVAAIKTIS